MLTTWLPRPKATTTEVRHERRYEYGGPQRKRGTGESLAELGLAFKMSEEAAMTWRRIRAPEKVAELLDWSTLRRRDSGVRRPTG